MAIQEWAVLHKKELSWCAGGALVMLVLFLLCFYLPTPELKDAPATTKDAMVTLHGIASPHVGITVFDKDGNAVSIVQTNDKGEFDLVNLPIVQGDNAFELRAIASGWRASFPLTVHVAKDTVAPVLSVNSLQGATVTGSNTVVSGAAEPGSTVTVNGVKTTVNADGNWSATVALKSGSNPVTVTATDPAGNTTTQTQTVQYQPTAPGSQTGTATVTASTTTLSPGSTASTSTLPTTTTPKSPTSPTPSPTPAPTPVPTPPPQRILSIVANAWVSNSSPNNRAEETIYASVKDNYGRAVNNASVIATVYYRSGIENYVLQSTGNGQYSTSFKLYDKYVSGFRVNVDVVAHLNSLGSTAYTSFTPM
jgi:hypothetical protein